MTMLVGYDSASTAFLEILSNQISELNFIASDGFFCFFQALLSFIHLMFVILVYRDANNKYNQGIMWAFIVFFFPFIGIIAYLVTGAILKSYRNRKQQYSYHEIDDIDWMFPTDSHEK